MQQQATYSTPRASLIVYHAGCDTHVEQRKLSKILSVMASNSQLQQNTTARVDTAQTFLDSKVRS